MQRNLDVIYPRHRALTRDAQALLQLLQTAANARARPEGAEAVTLRIRGILRLREKHLAARADQPIGFTLLPLAYQQGR